MRGARAPGRMTRWHHREGRDSGSRWDTGRERERETERTDREPLLLWQQATPDAAGAKQDGCTEPDGKGGLQKNNSTHCFSQERSGYGRPEAYNASFRTW